MRARIAAVRSNDDSLNGVLEGNSDLCSLKSLSSCIIELRWTTSGHTKANTTSSSAAVAAGLRTLSVTLSKQATGPESGLQGYTTATEKKCVATLRGDMGPEMVYTVTCCDSSVPYKTYESADPCEACKKLHSCAGKSLEQTASNSEHIIVEQLTCKECFE